MTPTIGPVEAAISEIDQLLADPDTRVRYATIRSTKALTPAQIVLALADPEARVRYAAAQRYSLTPEQVERALADQEWLVRYVAIRSAKTLIPAQFERALADPDARVREDAIRSAKTLRPSKWSARSPIRTRGYGCKRYLRTPSHPNKSNGHSLIRMRMYGWWR